MIVDEKIEIKNNEDKNEPEEQYIKIYFPEIQDVDKYEIKWNCLKFFRQAIKKLHNQKVTFGELSLAKIKIIELEHIETKNTIDLYFNLIDVFCDSDYCQSKDIWEKCKINYTVTKKLSDFYDYDDVLQKYKQNTEIFSIFKTDKITTNIINNNENINFSDEKYNDCKDDFKDIETKINSLVKYDDVLDNMESGNEELQSSAGIFKSHARQLHSRNICHICCNSIVFNKIKNTLYYIIFLIWIKDSFVWLIHFFKLTNRSANFDIEETPLEDIRTLLFKSEFNSESKIKLSNQLSQFVIDKFEVLGETETGCKEANNCCTQIVNTITNYVENGVINDKWVSQFIIPREIPPFDNTSDFKWSSDKYIQISNEYDWNNMHISQKHFVYFNNYGLKAIQNEINYFIEENLNNDKLELKLPDIYILSGFKHYPKKYEKDFYAHFNFKSSKCLDDANDLLKLDFWYPLFSIVCFIAQILGPIFYIIDYFVSSENDICPNRSGISTKLFATCYYLLLYAQFSKMWEEISITCSQYDMVDITKSQKYIIGSWVINNICLLIIPFFTYTLFIEHNDLTDLILNCLTGQFLIDIDNIVVTFSSGDFFLKKFIKDKFILEYIQHGMKINNIMDENSILQTSFNILGMIQVYSTIILSIVIARCI